MGLFRDEGLDSREDIVSSQSQSCLQSSLILFSAIILSPLLNGTDIIILKIVENPIGSTVRKESQHQQPFFPLKCYQTPGDTRL